MPCLALQQSMEDPGGPCPPCHFMHRERRNKTRAIPEGPPPPNPISPTQTGYCEGPETELLTRGLSSSRRLSPKTTRAITLSRSAPTSSPLSTPSLEPHAPCWTCVAPPVRPISRCPKSTRQPPKSPCRMKGAKGEVAGCGGGSFQALSELGLMPAHIGCAQGTMVQELPWEPTQTAVLVWPGQAVFTRASQVNGNHRLLPWGSY